MRLVHLPSGMVYSNWPTARSPLGHVKDVKFSAGGGLMAIANNKGKILLYRLKHFNQI